MIRVNQNHSSGLRRCNDHVELWWSVNKSRLKLFKDRRYFRPPPVNNDGNQQNRDNQNDDENPKTTRIRHGCNC